MTPLEPPDSHHVEAAKGWCQLHAFLEANQELEKVSPSLRAHPSVLEARWQVYANLGQWENALDIASMLVKVRPESPGGYYRASSLAELNRHLEAYETLSAAVSQFPAEDIVLYDLVCVCCALKRIDEARTWLGIALVPGAPLSDPAPACG